ncbi:MAG: hypothetical protein V4633_20115, partial [Pseudomonadota bacterium]
LEIRTRRKKHQLISASLGGANQFPPTLIARNVQTGEEVQFSGLDKPRIPNPNGNYWKIGAVSVKELPPGVYEIHDFVTPSVPFHVTVKPIDKPKIRFELQANKATYIGNINFYAAASGTYTLTVRDKRNRDLEIFAKGWRKIDLDTVEYALAKDVRGR